MFTRFQTIFAAWIAAAIVYPADPAFAQDSLIKTLDGKISIAVDIVSFDDETIFATSALGEHTFARSEVECTGAGCPLPAASGQASAQPAETAAKNPSQEGNNSPTGVGGSRSAVSDRNVTLTMKVGDVEIAGELIERTEREYILLTPTGEFRIGLDIVTCAGAACTSDLQQQADASQAAQVGGGQPGPSVYPTVTLVTNVGGVEIKGELKEFTGEEYVLETATGEYRLKAVIVSCIGAACPQINNEVADAPIETPQDALIATQEDVPVEIQEPAKVVASDADIRFSSTDNYGRDLLQSLWRGYANSLSLKYETDGSSDVSFFRDAAGALKETHVVEAGETEQPFLPLIENTAQFVLASRPPNALEVAALESVGIGNLMSDENHTVMAVSGIVVIVHPDNPVDALRLDEIQGIYSGSITNWSQVGGFDAPIQIFAQSEESAIRQAFERAIGNNNGFVLDPGVEASVSDDVGMREAIMSAQNSIGYVILDGTKSAKHLNIANTCGLDYVAIPFSINSQEYPITQDQYLFYGNKGANLNAKRFFEYAKSLSASESTGQVAFGIERQPEDFAADHRKALWSGSAISAGERDAARRLLYDLRDWDRVSTTIRFRIGSTQLSTQELLNIKKLVDYVGSQSDVTELAVVGFTDDIGSFSANLRLSRNRAKLVEEAISTEAAGELKGIEIFTKAYGELAPVGCNSDPFGRHVNRRVEIWVNSAR